MNLLDTAIKEAQEHIEGVDGEQWPGEASERVEKHMKKLARKMKKHTMVEEQKFVGEETAQIQTGQVMKNREIIGYNQAIKDINDKWDELA